MSAAWAAGADDRTVLAALGVGDVRHRCPVCGSAEHGRPVADTGGASANSA